MRLFKAVLAEPSVESLEHLVLEPVTPDSEIASQDYTFPRITNNILAHVLDIAAPSWERVRPGYDVFCKDAFPSAPVCDIFLARLEWRVEL